MKSSPGTKEHQELEEENASK